MFTLRSFLNVDGRRYPYHIHPKLCLMPQLFYQIFS